MSQKGTLKRKQIRIFLTDPRKGAYNYDSNKFTKVSPATDAGSSVFLFMELLAVESMTCEGIAACDTAGETLPPYFFMRKP